MYNKYIVFCNEVRMKEQIGYVIHTVAWYHEHSQQQVNCTQVAAVPVACSDADLLSFKRQRSPYLDYNRVLASCSAAGGSRFMSVTLFWLDLLRSSLAILLSIQSHSSRH